MKHFLPLLASLLLLGSTASAQLVISEIMYNPPETGNDSLEFVEITNAGDNPINLSGYSLIYSSSANNPIALSGTLAGGEAFVAAGNARAFTNVYGRAPNTEWTFSGLSNSGDRTLTVTDASGTTVSEVTYLRSAPWPSNANGDGPSIELCDLSADEADGSNWNASTNATGVTINGMQVFASPFDFSAGNCGGSTGNTGPYLPRQIDQLTGVDSDGMLDSIGTRAEVNATVISPDFDGDDGVEFYIQDNTGGIRVTADNEDYMPMIGDRIVIHGTVQQRDGSAEITLDSLLSVSAGNAPAPMVVTEIDEDIQGELVTLEDVMIADSTQWQTNGSFNVDVVDQAGMMTSLRIDADTDFDGLQYPTGTFDVTGIAIQFDTNLPYDEGYQLLPRFVMDFQPFLPGSGVSFPRVPIASVIGEDADGIATSLGEQVTLLGTVVGFNLSDNGLLFTIVDSANNGIALYSQDRNFGYVVQEGDSVSASGTITQFRGLTQLELADLGFASSGNPIPFPTTVNDLDESTESSLVTLTEVDFVDLSQWLGDGSTFNVEATNGRDTFIIRIDNNSELANMPAPMANRTYNITGIGGQFDNQAPFTEGYQLFPRVAADIDVFASVTEVAPAELFVVLAKADGLHVRNLQQLRSLSLYNTSGQLIAQRDNLPAGELILPVPTARGQLLFLRAISEQGQAATQRVLR